MECVCGKSFPIKHALSCQWKGFVTLRHNDIQGPTASPLSEVCSNVSIEPSLQELSRETLHASANRESEARMDIAMDGFWGPRREQTFIDIWVFNLFAPSNRKFSLASVYRSHERKKRRAYCQRVVEVKLRTFIPLSVLFDLWHG